MNDGRVYRTRNRKGRERKNARKDKIRPRRSEYVTFRDARLAKDGK